ncbi:DUF3573 domain-containing protein [Francisellaceae bacterium]|nr:DUF3573 domain-containing protein [Francisellaceae bacterium]
MFFNKPYKTAISASIFLFLINQGYAQGDTSTLQVIYESKMLQEDNKNKAKEQAQSRFKTTSKPQSLIEEINAFRKQMQLNHQNLKLQIDSAKHETKKLHSAIENFESQINGKSKKIKQIKTNIHPVGYNIPTLSHEQNHALDEKTASNVRNQGSMITEVFDDSDFGISTTFDAYPSSQVPYSLLKNKTAFGDRALVFGGFIQIDATKNWGSDFSALNDGNIATGDYRDGMNLNVTTINFDVMANINHWLQTFITISSFDLTDPWIRNAFVTFGNLDESPFFISVGKNRPPLGRFAGGGPLMAGITSGYFQPLWLPNVLFGYSDNGLNTYFSLFVPEVGNNGNYANDGSFLYSLFYTGNVPETDFLYGFNGAFMLNNQNTGMSVNTEAVLDPVSGNVTFQSRQDANSVLNFEGFLSYKDIALFTGWAGLTRAKSYTNNSLANAWYVQTTYSPIIYDRVTVFGVSWGQAYNTQEFFFPLAGRAGFGFAVQGVEKEFVAFIQRPFITPQVLLGIEYGWLGLRNSEHTSELTFDISVYF